MSTGHQYDADNAELLEVLAVAACAAGIPVHNLGRGAHGLDWDS